MNTDYLIPPLVFGMALSYVWIIHHFWLRQVFKDEYHKDSVHTRIPRPAASDPTSTRPFAVSAGVLTQLNGNERH